MLKHYAHLSLAALLIACTSCAPVSNIESKKRDNYELPASNLLVLEYVNKPDGDFLKETLSRFAACGIHAESQMVLIMGNDVAMSRAVEKPLIQKRIDAVQPKNILEIVPARVISNGYGNVISTDYMISLENLNGDKSWVGKLTLHQTQELISYFVNPPPSQSFADALVGKMVSDGVLTHCPVQNQ